jgi:hypothetical protein
VDGRVKPGHDGLKDLWDTEKALLRRQPVAGGFQMPRSCISRTCGSMTSRL